MECGVHSSAKDSVKPGSHTMDPTLLYDGKNNRNDIISMIRSH